MCQSLLLGDTIIMYWYFFLVFRYLEYGSQTAVELANIIARLCTHDKGVYFVFLTLADKPCRLAKS